MPRLCELLESLAEEPPVLEAYDRRGNVARKLDGRQLVESVRAHRSLFEAGDDGSRVVALLFKPEETIEFLVAAFAALSRRFTVVPLYPNWSGETQRRYLEAYDLRTVVVGEGFRSRADSWKAGGALRVIPFDLDSPPPSEGADPAADGKPLIDLPAEHSCAWIFTSGTSGKVAKLTDITLWNIDAAIEGISKVDFLRPGMTVHCPLSASHIFAFVVILGFLALRPRRLLFSDVQHLARLPRARTGRVDGMVLVPLVVNRMRSAFYEKLTQPLGRNAPPELKRLARIPLVVRRMLKKCALFAEEAILELEAHGRIGLRGWAAVWLTRRVFGRMFADRLGAPEFVVLGGAKPNLRAMAFVEAMGVRCLQGWGMTETTGPLAVCRLGDRYRGAFGTCGELFPGTEARIEDGELIIEGPQVARGYLEPDGTFVSFDGVKRTGDRGEFDRAGRLKILGKASQRITTANGLNYDPVPFEETLVSDDLNRDHKLEEAVVIGDGQPSLGCVFFLKGDVPDSDEARRYVASLVKDFNGEHAVDERIGPWTVAAGGVRETGFLGPTGKLVRRLVEEKYGTLFEDGGEGPS